MHYAVARRGVSDRYQTMQMKTNMVIKMLRIDDYDSASRSTRACAGTQWKACIAQQCSLSCCGTVQTETVFLCERTC